MLITSVDYEVYGESIDKTVSEVTGGRDPRDVFYKDIYGDIIGLIFESGGQNAQIKILNPPNRYLENAKDLARFRMFPEGMTEVNVKPAYLLVVDYYDTDMRNRVNKQLIELEEKTKALTKMEEGLADVYVFINALDDMNYRYEVFEYLRDFNNSSFIPMVKTELKVDSVFDNRIKGYSLNGFKTIDITPQVLKIRKVLLEGYTSQQEVYNMFSQCCIDIEKQLANKKGILYTDLKYERSREFSALASYFTLFREIPADFRADKSRRDFTSDLNNIIFSERMSSAVDKLKYIANPPTFLIRYGDFVQTNSCLISSEGTVEVYSLSEDDFQSGTHKLEKKTLRIDDDLVSHIREFKYIADEESDYTEDIEQYNDLYSRMITLEQLVLDNLKSNMKQLVSVGNSFIYVDGDDIKYMYVIKINFKGNVLSFHKVSGKQPIANIIKYDDLKKLVPLQAYRMVDSNVKKNLKIIATKFGLKKVNSYYINKDLARGVAISYLSSVNGSLKDTKDLDWVNEYNMYNPVNCSTRVVSLLEIARENGISPKLYLNVARTLNDEGLDSYSMFGGGTLTYNIKRNMPILVSELMLRQNKYK